MERISEYSCVVVVCSLDKKEEEVWYRPEGVMAFYFVLSVFGERIARDVCFCKGAIGIRLGFLHCRVSPILFDDPHPPLANTAGTGGAMAKKRGGRGG